MRCRHGLLGIFIEIQMTTGEYAEVALPPVQWIKALLHLANFNSMLENCLLGFNLGFLNWLLKFLYLAEVEDASNVCELIKYRVRQIKSDVASAALNF